jgi:hypothetical protein
MPPRVVNLLNAKGAKHSQELVFTNARGIVAALDDDVIGFGDPIDDSIVNSSRRSGIVPDVVPDSLDSRSDGGK